MIKDKFGWQPGQIRITRKGKGKPTEPDWRTKLLSGRPARRMGGSTRR